MVSRYVVTLANSIIGVSVLAMPFCFKQCGIVLATLLLMLGAILTRMVCYFLLKAATITRRRTYELLAYQTFGQAGKFMVEINIIGFLIGTMIAFMVVIGDLGPEILSEIFTVENNSSLRTIIMTALSLFVALPLGLLRNMDSLSSVSTASVLFYLFLVFKILSEGMGSLWSGSYLDKIDYWRPAGVLQCIPIFSMALSCQTQIFGIYDSLPEPSLQKMNEVVKKAINVCTFFYLCVGFFGYIAFCTQNFGGNILLSFGPSWSTQLIKICFLMSIVFSCPLVIFPCRASLHSLIFRRVHTHHHVHDISTNYIPDSRLKLLTVGIVAFTLVVGLIIPNIELVLGLVGSTTGSVICIIFPSIMFIRVTSKNTTERLLAQSVFFVGVLIMVLTTYVTLYAVEKSQVSDPSPIEQIRVTEIAHKVLNDGPQVELAVKSSERESAVNHIAVEFEPKIPIQMISKNELLKKDGLSHFVPSPVPDRVSSSPNAVNKIPSSEPKIMLSNDVKLTKEDHVKSVVETNEQQNQVQEPIDLPDAQQSDDVKHLETNEKLVADRYKPPETPIQPVVKPDEKPAEIQPRSDGVSAQVPIPVENKSQVVYEKRKESPVAAPEESNKKEFVEKLKAEEFLKKLEEHQENQKKLLEEQKEILAELKQHHAADVVRDGGNIETHNANINANEKLKEKNEPVSQDRIQTKEKQIIEKLSENLETEKRNEALLQKLEDGLNKEIKEIETKPKVPVELPVQPPPVRKEVAQGHVEKIVKNVQPEVGEQVVVQPESVKKEEQVKVEKKSVLEVLPPSAQKLHDMDAKDGKPLVDEKKTVISVKDTGIESAKSSPVKKSGQEGKQKTNDKKLSEQKAEREM